MLSLLKCLKSLLQNRQHAETVSENMLSDQNLKWSWSTLDCSGFLQNKNLQQYKTIFIPFFFNTYTLKKEISKQRNLFLLSDYCTHTLQGLRFITSTFQSWEPFWKPAAGADCSHPETADIAAACKPETYLCCPYSYAPCFSRCSPALFSTVATGCIIPTQGPLLSALLNVNGNLLRSVLLRSALPLLFGTSFALPLFVYQSADSCRKRENPLCSSSSFPPTPSLGACVPRDSLHFLCRYQRWPRDTQVRSHNTEEWVGVLISRHSAGGKAK